MKADMIYMNVQIPFHTAFTPMTGCVRAFVVVGPNKKEKLMASQKAFKAFYLCTFKMKI